METGKAARRTMPALWDPVAMWASVLDLPRQQAVAATDAACAMFGGVEAVRAIQERTAHQALERHAQAAQRLQGHCGPMEVLAVQLELARFDLEAAAAYWQNLAATTLQAQARMASCGWEVFDSDKVLEFWSTVGGH